MDNTPLKKYGNDFYWFFQEVSNNKEIAIWSGPLEKETIICRCSNKYDAKTIVDALLNFANTTDKSKLNNKELAFLDFVKANCVEPYATMASNAILWNDRETYNKLKSEFPVIYS